MVADFGGEGNWRRAAAQGDRVTEAIKAPPVVQEGRGRRGMADRRHLRSPTFSCIPSPIAAVIRPSPNAWGGGPAAIMEGAMPEIGLFEAIHTARSLRRFKPDPVPEALITQVLDAAMRAPSAGNAQNWAFVVIRDPEHAARARCDLSPGIRHRRGDVCGEGAARTSHRGQYRRLMTTGAHLWDHMGDAPVILVPCLHRPVLPPVESLPPDMRARHPEEQRLRRAHPRRQHLSGGAEHHPRLPRPRARHHDHHQSHPLRGRGAGAARVPDDVDASR